VCSLLILLGQLAAARAQELGIPKGDRNLQFAQLMGMADGLSLSLRNAGFQVSKYLPYGPVEQIIPYLIRRAEENRGLLSASSFDRQLLRYGLQNM
jgi:proline dehydrogenase